LAVTFLDFKKQTVSRNGHVVRLQSKILLVLAWLIAAPVTLAVNSWLNNANHEQVLPGVKTNIRTALPGLTVRRMVLAAASASAQNFSDERRSKHSDVKKPVSKMTGFVFVMIYTGSTVLEVTSDTKTNCAWRLPAHRLTIPLVVHAFRAISFKVFVHRSDFLNV